jgi:membrane-associated phospholipid phosphatase
MDRRVKTLYFLMLVSAVALSLAAHFFVVFPFDLKITHELQEEDNPVFVLVMQGVSAIGEIQVGILLAGVVSAFYIIRQRLPEACFILVTLSSFVLIALIKVLVARPRPPYFLPDPADTFQLINQYSFPSGHVLFFVVFFGFIAYLAWLQETGPARITLIAACGALILLIGPSRIFLGAHWASDVLGSYIIGVLWLSVIILGYHLVSYKRITGLKEN